MAVKDIITIKKADGSSQIAVLEDAPKDGDCLYTSIARLINSRDFKAKETSVSVRTKIADYLYDNWDEEFENAVRSSIKDRKQDFIDAQQVTGFLITDDLDSDSLKQQYTNLVRIPRLFWGEGISIAAADKLFNLNIQVCDNSGNSISGNTLSIDDDDTKETIYLNFVGGNHYRPLITLPEKIRQIWWDNLYDSTLLYDNANAIFRKYYAFDIPTLDDILSVHQQDLWNLLIGDLRDKSDEELKKFYEEIIKLAKKSSIGDTVDIDQKQKSNSSAANSLFSPEFFESIGKLFVALFGMFRKIVLSFNPGIELDESEKAWPFKDKPSDHKALTFHKRLVQIFDSAGEEGRKLYRSLLTRINQGEKLTSEQMLYELLKELKNSTLFKKTGHDIMSKIEDLLFGNESKIEDRIEKQLTEAFLQYYGGTQDELYAEPVKDGIYCEDIIGAIKKACAVLVNKIKVLKQKLTNNKDELSESEKFNLWQILQTSRLKLSSCLLKIKAFSQGTTVLSGGDFYEKFGKFFGKITDDLALKAAAEAADPEHGCADVSKGKSILKLFTCLDSSLDSNLLDKEFNKAVKEAKRSRRKEIVDQIDLINDRRDNKVSELQQFIRVFDIRVPDITPFNNLIAELNNCAMAQYEGEDISVRTNKDKFDPSGYKKIKELAAKYDKKVCTLEGYAEQIIANFNKPKPAAVAAPTPPVV